MVLEISGDRLRRLFAYWTQKKGDRRVPSRADIAPEEITDILPWVLLMERVGTRIRYRLVGDEFRQIYGDKLIGMYLDEIDLDHITAAYVEEYERAARDLMPVAPDDQVVNMYLTGAVGFGCG